MLNTSFEKQTCSRCNGSGNFSYCQGYGTRCFKCRGAGEVLTKRGAAAQAHYISLCEVLATELKPGDVVQTTGITMGASLYSYRATILEIGPGSATHTGSMVNGEMVTMNVQSIVIALESAKYGKSSMQVWENTKVRIFRADDASRIEMALAYQATLTKTGTVRKIKTK